MIKIYLASPYTIGDQALNVKKSIDIADDLIRWGYAPFCPLLVHFQHMVHPHDYETWMKLDLEWLSLCDCLYRLPGESKGADREVEFAKEHNIPVFFSMNKLRGWAKKEMNIEKYFITDGFGNSWDKICHECGKESMKIVRPGKVQCENCG